MNGRIEKIASEKVPRSFSVKDGHMYALESDLRLRSKLNKINNVVDQFFQDHTSLNTNDQIIKVRDAAQLPRKSSGSPSPPNQVYTKENILFKPRFGK